MRIRELFFVAIGVTIIQAAIAFVMDLNPATAAFYKRIRG